MSASAARADGPRSIERADCTDQSMSINAKSAAAMRYEPQFFRYARFAMHCSDHP